MIDRVKSVVDRISMSCFGCNFKMRVEHDNTYPGGRIFIQCVYNAPCTKTGVIQEWHGAKWYLSEHMTNDEILKKGFAAFQATVIHEAMEGYKVDGIILFNPHVDCEELLKISQKEISRS